MWRNMVEPDRPQMTMYSNTAYALCVLNKKATDTHSECSTLVASLAQHNTITFQLSGSIVSIIRQEGFFAPMLLAAMCS